MLGGFSSQTFFFLERLQPALSHCTDWCKLQAVPSRPSRLRQLMSSQHTLSLCLAGLVLLAVSPRLEAQATSPVCPPHASLAADPQGNMIICPEPGQKVYIGGGVSELLNELVANLTALEQNASQPGRDGAAATCNCSAIAAEDLSPRETIRVHRCVVPFDPYPGSDSHSYTFTATDCTNGIPCGNCQGFMSKNRQSGRDEDFALILPDEGSPGVTWTCEGCISEPTIVAYYYCFENNREELIEDAIQPMSSCVKHVRCSVPRAVTNQGLGLQTYNFQSGDCTGGKLPTGLCDVLITSTGEPGVTSAYMAHRPTDPTGPGMSWLQHTAAESRISPVATYMCYKPVNILPTQQVASVHRCSVPSSHPVTNGSNSYTFVSGDCTNGLPEGDCDGMMTKQVQCGTDEDFAVFSPSGGSTARVEWFTGSACGQATVQVVYMCYSEAQKAALPYTRHICSANPNLQLNGGHTYRYTAADCGGELPTGNCYGFLHKARQCNSDEDWTVLEPNEGGAGVSWWTNNACSVAQLSTIYHCWN
eukprot:m.255132 g.255132  ORF g.255132 m.255132 type:complete len:533 (+) comp11010_c0_seq8:438-2036(+)